MRTREIPSQVVWIVVVVFVLGAVYLLWNAGGVRSAPPGGQPTARDLELLKRMGEAREKAGAGRSLSSSPADSAQSGSSTPQNP